MESGSVFKVLKKFMGGQEKKRSLLDNAMGVVKRDHLLAQLQAETAGAAGSAEPKITAALALADEVPELPAKSVVPSTPTPTPKKAQQKRGRSKKPAKKTLPEQPPSAFEFMAKIDLDLKGTALESVAPPETPGLPPDFEAKLQHLSSLMNFEDC